MGSGIAAVLVVTPPALSFGEVQVGEPKSLEVQVLNAGSTALVLPSVMVTPASPSLTGTAFALQRSYEPGAQATATVVFTPSAAAPLSAVLDLGRVQVPVTGQGVQALPRLCVRLDDQAERCTEPAVDSLLVDFGSVCERDGGACSSSDGGVGRLESTARFSVRNEGNTSVSYSLRYESWLGERCDAGSQLDFAFSNSAGDGVKWSEPTTALPLQRGDPKPWQTAPVSVTYRPTSSCAGDTIDRARVTWLRQGDPTGARLPAMLTVNFVGRSE